MKVKLLYIWDIYSVYLRQCGIFLESSYDRSGPGKVIE